MNEYRVIHIDPADIADDIETQLNAAARDGWELVGTDLPWVYLRRAVHPYTYHFSDSEWTKMNPDGSWAH